jgi:hypothetical protein
VENELEDRAYPEVEPLSELDRQMFGPVDYIARTNKRLTTVAVALAVLAVVAVTAITVLVYHFEGQPVRVLNINDAGQVDSFLLRTSGFSLHKTETQAALHNAIANWAEGYYSRIRTPMNGEIATLAFPRSFIFFGHDLAEALRQRQVQSHEVANFMSSGDPEFRVFVTNVVFRNLARKPYDADVYFDRVYYSQPLNIVAKKSSFVPVQFAANPTDEEIQALRKREGLDIDTLMRVNPLVLAITQIGDERSFNPSPTTGQ